MSTLSGMTGFGRADGAGEGCLKRGGELAQRMMAAGDRLQKAGEGK